MIQGHASQRTSGAILTEAGFATPKVDKVFRFFRGLWLGVDVMFILFARDLDRHKTAMITLLRMVILGGLGQIHAMVQYGLPDHTLGTILVALRLLAEVIISPVILRWLLAQHRTKSWPLKKAGG